jgi:nucleoside 2-deoxyribosyltransferase
MKTVYLAGPISGTSYGECTDWRIRVVQELFDVGIKGLSPMRGKEYLSHVKEFTSDGDKYKPYGVMSTNHGIITRDRYDATRCDVLLVNFLDAPKVSIGTCMEIAWADLARIPIVCAMEASGNAHEHGMILEAIGFKVPTLEEAVLVTKMILL